MQKKKKTYILRAWECILKLDFSRLKNMLVEFQHAVENFNQSDIFVWAAAHGLLFVQLQLMYSTIEYWSRVPRHVLG